MAAHRPPKDIPLLEMAVEHIRDALVVVSAPPKGRTRGAKIVYVNPGYTALTGFAAEEAIGGSPDRTFGEKTDGAAVHALLEAIDAQKPIRVELLKYRKDGSTFWGDVDVSLVRDARGRCTHFVYVMRDISAQKSVAQNLEQATTRLEQASALKSQFLANISHELRTPLNAILGTTSMLAHGVYGPMTGPQVKALARTQANGKNLMALIDQILDVTKIVAGRTPFVASRFCLAELVQEVVTDLEPMVRELTVTVRGPRRFMMRTDRQKTKQIVMNLVANALKFTPRGWVRITIKPSKALPARVSVVVADSGVGIAPENHARVFDEFWQADTSMTRTHGGTGLGLAICRGLASAIGGEVTVESELGRGSIFTLRAPVDGVRALEERKRARRSRPPPA